MASKILTHCTAHCVLCPADPLGNDAVQPKRAMLRFNNQDDVQYLGKEQGPPHLPSDDESGESGSEESDTDKVCEH